MAYQYAAFFSYKRDPESDGWHRKLKEKIEHQLRLRLGAANSSIFFDNAEIRTGDEWEQRLADGLRRSKCIVCVWSPAYFQSRWCNSELRTFEDRETLSGGDLIVPASYQDGESFPANARKKQFKDFSQYASSVAVFWESLRFLDFEPLIAQFADDLAKKLSKAPLYSDRFPIVKVPEEEVMPEQTIGRIADN